MFEQRSKEREGVRHGLGGKSLIVKLGDGVAVGMGQVLGDRVPAVLIEGMGTVGVV